MNINSNSQNIDLQYESIADCAMVSIYNKRPYMFQKKVISHLLKMINYHLHPRAILVVQSTGGGKSAIPQTTAVADGGVTIILENTLALAADQHSKIENIQSDNVFSFHLDTVKTNDDKKQLSSTIHSLLLRDNRLSILLFASPECIVDDVWVKMIHKLIADTLLKLVCVDEVHQFVEFGLTFRKSFMSLKDTLFKLLCVTESQDKDSLLHTILKVPLLFMSATMNTSLVDLLQKIVGIQLSSNNIYWGDATYFRKRNITISSNYTTQYLRNVKLSIAALMKKDNNAKVIICSNTAKKLQNMQCSFDDWLNEVNIDGDSVLVVGDVKPELKYAYTIAFTRKSTTIGNSNEQNGGSFNPKFLFGTSG